MRSNTHLSLQTTMATDALPSRRVTSLLMGDPAPDRAERAEALRRALPEPRTEQPLSEWLVDRAEEQAAA